ncbi:hypothetical protein [Exiguobacterium artemiae]
MRTTSDKARFAETKKLLDYGFSSFEPLTYYGKGEQIKGVLPIRGTKQSRYDVVTKTALYVTVLKNQAKPHTPVFQFSKAEAPLKEGEIIGTVQVEDSGRYLPGFTVPQATVTSAAKVELASFQIRLFRAVSAWSKKSVKRFINQPLSTVKGIV